MHRRETEAHKGEGYPEVPVEPRNPIALAFKVPFPPAQAFIYSTGLSCARHWRHRETEQAMMSAHEEPNSNGGERRQTGDKSVSNQGSWEVRAGGWDTLSNSHRSITTGHRDAEEHRTRSHTHLYTELTTALFPVANSRNNPNVHQL